MEQQKERYTAQEVANIAGVNVLTVYRWIRSGKLKATKLGQWKIYRKDLEDALGIDPDTFKRPEG